MKKLIGIGIVIMMVVGLATAANATAAAWTVSLRAGVLTGAVWSNAQNATSIALAATATATYHASLTSLQAGFYGVDPDPAKMANKDQRIAGGTTYTWNMHLATGASWVTTQTCTLAWYIPVVAQSPTKKTDGTTEAAPLWSIKVYKGEELQNSILDNGLYGATNNHIIGTYTLTQGLAEDWKIVATKVVPEPGTILAALSILAPAGMLFRRRKI